MATPPAGTMANLLLQKPQTCNTTSDPYAPPPICCAGGKGTLLGAGIPFPAIDEFESAAGRPMVAVAYLVLLLWTFMGVALAADVFMAAIEEVTSKETEHVIRNKDGKVRRFRARMWNATVANLTLMALGSSAPEILLSLIELLTGSFYSGALGPSTIVGSAAFNLLVIIAVCVVAIPATDHRRIEQPKVYLVTAFASTFAYVWLVIILMVWSPDVIELSEAILTFLFFPLLVLIAYLADRLNDQSFIKAHPALASLCCIKPGETLDNFKEFTVLMELKAPDGSPASKEEVIQALRKLRANAEDANGGGRGSDGNALTDEEMYEQLIKQAEQKHSQPRSRAYYRVQATRKLTGGSSIGSGLASVSAPKTRLLSVDATNAGDIELAQMGSKEPPPKCTVQFAASEYSVMEGGGAIAVQVIRVGSVAGAMTVGYKTEDITAEAGEDYEGVKDGQLEFESGERTKTISIPIFDDDVVEDDEKFMIKLTGVTAGEGALGPDSITRVTIINDDFPGTFVFPDEDVHVREDCGSAEIFVHRVKGCSGEVSLTYRTVDGTALAGKNYDEASGALKWAHGDVAPKAIKVPITDDSAFQGKQYFDVEISDATGGAKFDERTDGSIERSLARVTIEDDEKISTMADRAMALMGVQHQSMRLGASSWGEQFSGACQIHDPNDEVAGEEVGLCSRWNTYMIHFLTLPWKLLVACVPPTTFCGGWLCFVVAIVVIGGLTALIGDLANLLGCALGIKDSVVAITLVALGTSLPDTFASKSAALGDPSADAAIGNVTGSNSVNVFLGLGISWLAGAIYWSTQTASAEWMGRYPEIALRYNVQLGGPLPGLAVPAGDLGFSVAVFVGCSLACLLVIQIRRVNFKGELGDEMRWPTAIFFVGLWLTYVVMSTLKAYGVM